MIYSVGDRVRCGTSRGTIREAIRQRNTGDLFRIDWDGEPRDDDLYQDVLLVSLTTADIEMRWAA
jgi:hypothetical protein